MVVMEMANITLVEVDLAHLVEEDEVAEGLVEAEAVVVITEAVASAVQVTKPLLIIQKTCRRGEVFRTKTEPRRQRAY
ncbi:hypothetical protein ScPMuIL_005342 [Solemya velum]